MTTINNNSANLGLSGLTKRVGAGAESAKGVNKATGTGGFANDALVRTGGTAAAGATAGAAGAKALNDLADAYDVDQFKFACNLAEKALSDVCSLVG